MKTRVFPVPVDLKILRVAARRNFMPNHMNLSVALKTLEIPIFRVRDGRSGIPKECWINVGTDSENDIVLESDFVEPRHGSFAARSDGTEIAVYYQDHGSHYGSYVGSERISRASLIPPEHVNIGRVLTNNGPPLFEYELIVYWG